MQLLENRGYVILERNWRYGRFEVDVIARDGPTFAFIEVKLRKNSAFGAPEEAVTLKKLHRIAEAAQRYLDQQGTPDADWRIDVVAIEMARDRIRSTLLIKGASEQ